MSAMENCRVKMLAIVYEAINRVCRTEVLILSMQVKYAVGVAAL
jgi:hypothetical protein